MRVRAHVRLQPRGAQLAKSLVRAREVARAHAGIHQRVVPAPGGRAVGVGVGVRVGGWGERRGEGRGERVRGGSAGELYVTTVGVSARRSIEAATRKARSTSPTLAKALIRELTVCVSGVTPCCCMS